MRFLAVVLIFLTAPFFIYSALAIWYMSQTDVESLVICATNEDSHNIPIKVCESYLTHFRLDPEDIEAFEASSGLTFLIPSEDGEERERMLSLFLSKGADINKNSPISGLNVLHAAVLENDAQLLEYLLSKGADPTLKSRDQGLTPLELLDQIQKNMPETDLSESRSVLSRFTEKTGP